MRLAAVYFPESSQFGVNTINFGGRFNYKIEKNSQTVNLTREINEKFIDDFFSKEISNIGVIVGKNGVGKTTFLFELLFSKDLFFVYENDNLDCLNHWFVSSSEHQGDLLVGIKIIKEKTNDLSVSHNLFSEKNHYGLNISNNLNFTPKFFYYSPLSNFNSATKYKDSFIINSDSIYEVKSQTLQRQVSFLIQKDLIKDLKGVYKDFPIYENIKIKLDELINPDLSNLDYRFYTLFKNNDLKTIKGIHELERDKILLESYEIDIKEGKYFNVFKKLSVKSKQCSGRKRIYIETYIRLLFLIFTELGFKNLDKITNVINILMNDEIYSDNDFIDNVNTTINRTIDLSQKRSEGALIELFQEVENIIINIFKSIPENQEYKNLEISLNVLYDNYFKFIKFIDNHCRDFISNYELHFLKFESDKNLSQGEEYLLNLFSSIFSNEYIGNHSNAILLFDEPDLGFHPQWKKKLVNALTIVLPKLIKATNPVELGVEKINIHESLQIIFTTHNPLTLSDIPNDKIIYLDKKNGKVLINNDDRPIKSFGANITDLLADSFFVKDGLIGDFAKEKIEITLNWLKIKANELNKSKGIENSEFNIDPTKIMKFETEQEEFKYHRQIINLIDEPLVKSKLMNMYTDYVKEDISFLKAELEKAEQKVLELKKRIN